jgi:dihydrofolate reductase
MLIMKMSMSLDGFVSGPHDENDWVFKSSDETSRTWSLEQTWKAGLIIMGRKTFEKIGPYWPTAPGPFAAPMNEIPKAVFTKNGSRAEFIQRSSRPPWLPGPRRRSLMAILPKDQKLKNESETDPGIGGAGFMRSLIETGLIDEFQIIIHPVALGSGGSSDLLRFA